MRYPALVAVLVTCAAAAAEENKTANVEDPFIAFSDALCEANEPAPPAAGSYGMDRGGSSCTRARLHTSTTR